MSRTKLPEARVHGSVSIEQCLLERRSIRSYRFEPLTLADVSQLLWAAQGITRTTSFRTSFRTAPSAGALFPLELYLAVGHVDDLPAGVYKYGPPAHELTVIAGGDIRNELSRAALGQPCVKDAPLVLAFSAVYERVTRHYGQRGIRYVYMEVGHAAQNVHLQVISLNIGAVVIGAFDDVGVKGILNMADNEDPLYLMPVGKVFPH